MDGQGRRDPPAFFMVILDLPYHDGDEKAGVPSLCYASSINVAGSAGRWPTDTYQRYPFSTYRVVLFYCFNSMVTSPAPWLV